MPPPTLIVARAVRNATQALWIEHAAPSTVPLPVDAVAQRELVRALLARHGWNTASCQIANPGIAHWFSPDQDAVVGYVAAGGVWVVAGAPVCAPEHRAAVAGAFEAAATRQGRRVCYFGAQAPEAEDLAGTGPLARLLIGAQPVWDPRGWPAIVACKASLRSQIARARNKDVAVHAWPAERAARQPELQRCLHEWLASRGLPPMHFLVEPATLRAPEGRRVFVAQRHGTPVAYLVATPVPRRAGWLFEQIVRSHDAPNGTTELLIDSAMRELAADGAAWITLGLAPLSRIAAGTETSQGALVRLLRAWARDHGRRFYHFAGLEAFRARLQPAAWEPVYLLSRERRTSLRTLYAVAWAFGGTAPPRFVARALLRAWAAPS
ncbi:MAG: DUF2156 domain-containing protein [Chloroflexi bacterium]|nr:DUF2156 domain-containing protein [Chloroflexota bacterium]